MSQYWMTSRRIWIFFQTIKRGARSECKLRDPCSDGIPWGMRPKTKGDADVIILLDLGDFWHRLVRSLLLKEGGVGLVLCMAWPEAVSQAKLSQAKITALWWLWPGLVFWKAKTAGSGHGFNFHLKILKKKNFTFEIFFFVCGLVYTDVWGGFLDTELVLTCCEEVYEKKKKLLLNLLVLIHIPKKPWPRPSHVWWLWPGLVFEEAKATSGQAKAGGFQAKPEQH